MQVDLVINTVQKYVLAFILYLTQFLATFFGGRNRIGH